MFWGCRLLRRGMRRIWRDAWGSEVREGRGEGRVGELQRSLRLPRAQGETHEVQLGYPGEWGTELVRLREVLIYFLRLGSDRASSYDEDSPDGGAAGRTYSDEHSWDPRSHSLERQEM